ncbi:MAG: S-layer protein, could be associated with type IV pili like system [Candidatus Methanohalarchaeum thermophilum]|uniref:S-layer protein, could be associated with type IV pili like system n=1 Tax=Methanohalarchaeum thermophilum TaxID=1903181 RepID=A0A1Q6DX54_METT1|nr:MAG: S-layer protein, could be associated with type IV pili like system [Candidatus Methanohalarchaeum thermophilum]
MKKKIKREKKNNIGGKNGLKQKIKNKKNKANNILFSKVSYTYSRLIKYRFNEKRRLIHIISFLILILGILFSPIMIQDVKAENSSGTVRGYPDLNLSAPNARLDPGQQGTVGITVTNNADIEDEGQTHPEEARTKAGEARSVRLNITDTREAPITVKTGQRSIGTIQNGEASGPHNFDVIVNEDADSGTYKVEVTMKYRHAETVRYNETKTGDLEYNETVVSKEEIGYITVVIEPEARFDIKEIKHDVPLGGEGTVTLKVMNTGDEDVEDSTLSVTSSDSDFYFGSRSTSSEAMAGKWFVGETKEFKFRAGTSDSAVKRPYPIDATIEFTDSENQQDSETNSFGITPQEKPRFRINSTSHNVPLDGEGIIKVKFNYTGDERVSNVSISASTQESEIYLGSEESRSAEAFFGKWDPGEEKLTKFRVGTTSGSVDRAYPIQLDFKFTDKDDNENTITDYLKFNPHNEPSFPVESVRHDIPIGGTGRIKLNLTNNGPLNATETSITFSSSSDALFFGSGGTSEQIEAPSGFPSGFSIKKPDPSTPTSETFIGNWSVGENKTLIIRAGFEDTAIKRNYSIDVSIDYKNSAGNEMPSQSYSIGLEPLPIQEFNFKKIESDLYIGEEGDLLGEITNTGNRSVKNVVVIAKSERENIHLRNTRYTVGDLDPGETRDFRHRISVTEEAEYGPRIFEFSARYRDPYNNIKESDTRDLEINIAPERDSFIVKGNKTEFEAGDSGELVLNITNNKNESLRNIQAKLFTSIPLDTEDEEAFIKELKPNESKNLSFKLSVEGSAMQKTYPVSIDFRYDGGQGDSHLSDTYRVPIKVTKPDSIISMSLFIPILCFVIGITSMAWYKGDFSQLSSKQQDPSEE